MNRDADRWFPKRRIVKKRIVLRVALVAWVLLGFFLTGLNMTAYSHTQKASGLIGFAVGLVATLANVVVLRLFW